MSRLGTAFVSLCVVLLLNACGFHLRGNAQISPQYNPLYLQTGELTHSQKRLIENALIQASASLSDDFEQANRLSVRFTRGNIKNIASSSGTDVDLIGLSMKLIYSVTSSGDEIRVSNKEIIHRSELELDGSNVLSHKGLIDKQFEAMQRSLVRAMIYQLKTQP